MSTRAEPFFYFTHNYLSHFRILRNKESCVPDTGQPVGDQSKGTHEEEEDGGAILRVAVQLPGHTNQSQQASCFQQTDQGGGLAAKAGVTRSMLHIL